MSAPTIFVYGTLMRGASHHRLLEGASFLGTATAAGFELVDLGSYPALTEGEGLVHGEVYRIPAALLPILDAYEDHPKVYRRSSIPLSDGRRAEAYLLPVNRAGGFPRIASGRWRGPGKS